MAPAAQSRSLRRQGAFSLLTEAEREVEAAMLRSSPPPELSILGKRPRQERHPAYNGDPESEDDSWTTPSSQASAPSISNITTASLRYATRKKLRADQRDELEAFLLVSPIDPLTCCSTWTSEYPGRI